MKAPQLIINEVPDWELRELMRGIIHFHGGDPNHGLVEVKDSSQGLLIFKHQNLSDLPSREVRIRIVHVGTEKITPTQVRLHGQANRTPFSVRTTRECVNNQSEI